MRRLPMLPLVLAALLSRGVAHAAPASTPPPASPPAATLDAVHRAGVLRCGVVSDEDDYSEADRHGNLTALGADLCRALAAETLGDASRARFLTLRDEPDGLAALRDRRIEVLFGTTPDPVIGQVYRAAFGPPVFIDGQGFLVSKRSGIADIAGLAGRHVCVINASPPERLLDDALAQRLVRREADFPFSERGEMEVALLDGHCDAITGDVSWMANVRAGFRSRANEFAILPDTISTDPFAPAYRDDDRQWAALVDWTVWSLMQAEAHGVTRADVAAMRGSADPVARRLAGGMPWIARSIGLADDAFARAIASVGNYGEMFDRDVGAGSRLDLPRGRNRLSEQGGLMWALPVEPLQ